MEKCINHPVRNASTRCKRCHSPVCIDCRIKAPEGFFCSDACIQEYRTFQEKVYSPGAKRGCGCGCSILGLIKTLVISAVLIAVIWFTLTTWLGTDDPGEMVSKVGQMMKLIF